MDRKGCLEHISTTKVKKSSLKSLEEKRKKQRESKRRQREKMKQNPEAREKFKEKERENYKKKKECGKIKLVANLTPREERQRRKEWRTRQNKCRQKKKQLNEDILANANSSLNTPSNTNQIADGRRLSGRKRVRKERSAVYRALIKSQEEVAKYKKMSAKLKKRLQRNKDNKQFETPNRKVNRILRSASKKEIRKKLLFGEVLELELKEKAKEISTESEKRKFTNIVSGKIIKKYKLLQKTKFFLSNRQRLNIGCQPVKRRKKANLIVTLQLKDKVVKFFEDDASSALTPGKKEFVTKNKIRKQKRILLYSLKKLHQKFNQSFGNIISYPTFCKLKPFWVVHPKVNQRDTCLCIKHANFQYLIDKLHFLKLLPQKSSHDASAAVCCDTLSQACMYRQCSRCKHKTLAITVSQDKKTEETFYYQWLPKTEERKNKDKIIRVKFTVKNKIVSTVEELINVAKTRLNGFLKHSYNYHHQLSSMKSLRTSLNPNEVIVVIDFSENYLCKYASEVQSAHFGASKQQVSLHTGVIYKQNMSLQDEITSFCTISDILRHDASAVWAHIVPIINLIRVKYTDVETIHFQSDGPTNQYRNRTNFYFLTLFAQKFNLKSVTWNFTESGHGKGPADGIGGTVKRTADEIVAFGSDINNAKILFQCLSAVNLKVQFFEISEADINAIDDLKPKDTAIPSIPNLMKLHQLTWNKFENVKLQLRYLSCFTCDTHEKCRHYSSEPSFVDLSPCFKNMPNECKCTEVSTPDLEREHIRVGAWVAVVYDENWFPGLIEEINDDILKINFMLRNGSRFYWPNTPDIQDVPKNEILCVIDIPPRPITSRYFTIDKLCDVNLKMNNISRT